MDELRSDDKDTVQTKTVDMATASPGKTSSKQGAKEMPDRVDETNAKIVAFTLLLLVLLCHGVSCLLFGRDTCSDLLKGGRYLGPDVWQPNGCMMHKYSKSDSMKCFEGHHVIFIGDSRMRQLFFAFTQKITSSFLKEEKFHQSLQHIDEDTNTKSEFLWQPEVNKSLVQDYTNKVVSPPTKPLMVVLGVATWTIKQHNAALDVIAEYTANLTNLRAAFEHTDPSTNIFWMMQAFDKYPARTKTSDPPNFKHYSSFKAKVQGNLLKTTQKMITNSQLRLYNSVTADLLKNINVNLWYSAMDTSNQSHQDTLDGLHFSDEALEMDVQLLLNFMCNSKLQPSDATCCTGMSSLPNLLQILTFCCFLLCGMISLCLRVRLRHIATRPVPEPGPAKAEALQNHVQPTQEATAAVDLESGEVFYKVNELMQAYELTSSLAKFGVILVYFYLADRTDLLGKEQKYFTYKGFFVPFVYVTILGLFFVKKVPKPVFLNVPQTTEWKGWMQLGILIYHITGASQKIPIYMHVRILVASYLFMTGYGQFTASWDRKKFGLVRVCQVLFRQNLLVVLLCLVMDRPYQFYYFVPLVSFWYILIYAVMALPPRVTRESAEDHPSHNVYMLLKLGVFISLCVTVSVSEIFFNSLFNWWPINTLFYWPGQSLHEWWFRWRLDRYIVVYGMLFAMGYIHLRVSKRLNDSHQEDLFSRTWTWISNSVGVVFIAIYTVHSFMCNSKPSCNEVHTYISALPVAGVVILRNTSGLMRTRYSTFFAWFGTISLELFISQYHIWLAQDTKGILVLIPGHPSLNLFISTFIFIFLGHEISCLTTKITKCVISEDYPTTRNRVLVFLIFLATLLAYSTFS